MPPPCRLPSAKERMGDFTDWRDANGNLIPIYDPATLRAANGAFVKDQFMGATADTERDLSIAHQPARAAVAVGVATPTSAGPLNNFLAPAIPDTILGNANFYMGRYDLQLGDKDHLFASIWHQTIPAKFNSNLPESISFNTYSRPQNSWVNRFNYDRIRRPLC